MNQYVKNLGKVRPTTEGDHDINKEYDILSIVTVGSSSYISRKFVPIGTSIDNKEYWQLLAKGGTSNNDDPDIDNEQLEQIINDISNQSIALTNHVNDNNAHTTNEEKNRWNNGIVTDEERETWNDGIITEEERQRWNQGVGGESYTADEEDITLTQNADSTGRVYQFKNRDTSKGMGYIILRTDKTLAEQITEENTIYEIRYDFDLDGETLEIPADCVLDFNGGKISNGILKGNNTFIQAADVQLFDNLVFDGRFANIEFYAAWFGAKTGSENDATESLQNAIDNANVTYTKRVILSEGTYYISGTLKIPSRFKFGGKPKSSGAVWSYRGELSTIYQTKNLPAIQLGESGEEVRGIEISNLAIGISDDYSENTDNLYGISTSGCSHFAFNNFENVWISKFKKGIVINITNGGGLLKNTFNNVALNRNTIGIHVEGVLVGTTRPWFNDNYFINLYLHENKNIGFYITNIWSVQSLVFQNCNFEQNGKGYDEDVYNEIGCFGFKSSADFGITAFRQCYFEGNYARSSENVLPSEINYSKESNVIVRGGDYIFEGNVMAATQQLITVTNNASIVLRDNDYYITKALNSNTSKSIIRYTGLVSSYVNLYVREKKFTNTYLTKVYEFGFTDLSSNKSFYQSNIDIDTANWGKEYYKNQKYENGSIFHINAETGNVNYTGLTVHNPFKSFSDFHYYGLIRFTNVHDMVIWLDSDVSIPTGFFNNLITIYNRNIIIEGNGKTLTMPASTYLVFNGCNITVKNATIVLDNSVGYINAIQLQGKSDIKFVNCTITFNTANGYYLVDAAARANVNCEFITCTINCLGSKVSEIYLTKKRGYASLNTTLKNCTNEQNIDYMSDERASNSALLYLDKGNMTPTRAHEIDGYVYGDSEGLLHNFDGSLLDKVSIVTDFSKADFSKVRIYKIVGNIDLGGETLSLVNNCTLDFTSGGTIKNGTINLQNTLILPLGSNVATYITATITGSYRKGQTVYDASLNKQKLWNGTAWVNLDGTEL